MVNPPPAPTMCDHCTKANVDCPEYPLQTVKCVEFTPRLIDAPAWEFWLVRNEKDKQGIRNAAMALIRKDVSGELP